MVWPGYHGYAGNISKLIRSDFVHKLVGTGLHALSEDDDNGVIWYEGGYSAAYPTQMRRGNGEDDDARAAKGKRRVRGGGNVFTKLVSGKALGVATPQVDFLCNLSAAAPQNHLADVRRQKPGKGSAPRSRAHNARLRNRAVASLQDRHSPTESAPSSLLWNANLRSSPAMSFLTFDLCAHTTTRATTTTTPMDSGAKPHAKH